MTRDAIGPSNNLNLRTNSRMTTPVLQRKLTRCEFILFYNRAKHYRLSPSQLEPGKGMGSTALCPPVKNKALLCSIKTASLLQQIHSKPRLVFRIMNEKPFHSGNYQSGFRSKGTGRRQEMFNDANNTTINGGTFNIGSTFENGMPI